MYSSLIRTSLLILMILTCTTMVVAEDVQVFVLGGQSNMSGRAQEGGLPGSSRPFLLTTIYSNVDFRFHDGNTLYNGGTTNLYAIGVDQSEAADCFGPELALAADLTASGETTPQIAMVKVAYGGTSLAVDWDKGNTSGRELYQTMIDQVHEVTQEITARGDNPVISGVFWMQGEADAYSGRLAWANAYEANLRDFISNVRSDLSAPNAPFIIGQISDIAAAGYTYRDIVADAQHDVVYGDNPVPMTALVDTFEFSRFTTPVSYSDHFDTEGMIDLGEGMADAYLNIPEPTTISLFVVAGAGLIRRRTFRSRMKS